MRMNKVSNLVIHLHATVEILVITLIPIVLLSKGFSPIYSMLAGWVFGFLTPSTSVHHEWIHNNNKKGITRVLFHIQQVLFFLSNFEIHHNNSHHNHANTSKDYGHPMKNSSVLGYVYGYLIKPVPYYLKNYPKIFIPMNLLSIAFMAGIFFTYGLVGLCFQIGCIAGFYYTVFVGNYIQHYGLETLPIAEKEKATYAWDDTSPLSEYLSFNLTIHSDHHANAKKPFNELKHQKGQPVVPHGIPVLMLLFPTPLFNRIMNKRLDDYISRKFGE
jgi:alkane 1-monooxygenase